MNKMKKKHCGERKKVEIYRKKLQLKLLHTCKVYAIQKPILEIYLNRFKWIYENVQSELNAIKPNLKWKLHANLLLN